jgi:hypothetical protein
MNTIVILCGSNCSGKTSTIKGFFNGKYALIDNHMHFFERTLDGVRVYAVNSGSPHELVKDFCRVDLVNRNIERRIEECDKRAGGQSYILIIPFTISENQDRTRLNDTCILEPISELKKKFTVFTLYLNKKNARRQSQKDALMKLVKDDEIETKENDCDKSAWLEDFIRKHILSNIS